MSKNDENLKGTRFISMIAQTSAICEYGISSIFTLFLMYVLNFSNPIVSHIFANYYGFAYIIPIIIGIISDNYLKKSTSLTIGFIFMIISQILLFYSTSLHVTTHIIYHTILLNPQTVSYFIGLFFLALGTGFINNTIPNMINSLNPGTENTNAFSFYYGILNIGVLIGVLLMILIAGGNYYLYQWGFLAFAIILSVGLISFRLFKNKSLVDINGNLMKDTSPKDKVKNKFSKKSQKKTLKKHYNYAKERYKLMRKSLTSNQKDKLIVFFIFLLMTIIFRIAYSQTNITMVFFIDNYVQRDFDLYEIPVNCYFLLNPLFIIILTPLFTKLENKLEERNLKIGYTNRIILGLFFMALCFSVLVFHGYYIDNNITDKISIFWIIIFEFFISVSELCISVAGYSMVGDLTPKQFYSMFFGIFIATKAISMYLTGIISGFFPDLNNIVIKIGAIPINGLMNYFLIFVILNIIAAAILFIFRKKINRKMHFNETEKTA